MVKKKIIVVIPAYNEEKTIGGLLKKIKKEVDEIIVIDDFSTDKTGEISLRYAQVIKNKKNEGYDKSINKGFKLAKKLGASIIITMDADDQHLASEINKFVEPIISNNCDIVVGIRPYKARFMEIVFGWLGHKYGINDPLCGMKSYNVQVYNHFNFFDTIESIGTQLIFAAYFKNYKIKEKKIKLKKRLDTPRFGNQIKGNYKLFISYLKLIKYIKLIKI